MRATQSQELQVSVENPHQEAGVRVVLEAIEAPLRQMASNAGESPDIIVKIVRESSSGGNSGYNFVTGEVCDFFDAGVVDPVRVTKAALQNAASVAGTLITTNCAIIQK
jgi:chaperonin GroEL